MKIYIKVASEEIEEYLDKIEKPRIYKGLEYPYNSLDHRVFEILIYLLYEEEIRSGIYNKKYDRVHSYLIVSLSGIYLPPFISTVSIVRNQYNRNTKKKEPIT